MRICEPYCERSYWLDPMFPMRAQFAACGEAGNMLIHNVKHRFERLPCDGRRETARSASANIVHD
jgi:hypothetical protein